MTSKHSPGPWSVQVLEHSFRVVDARALKFNNSRLCDVQHWSGATRGPDRAESKANARLIAAAPELLDALKHIDSAACYASEVATETREAMLLHIGQTARAAIAKAEGGAV